MKSNQRKLGGFTKLELAIVIGVIALLFCLCIGQLFEARERAAKISCISHIKQVGLGFRIWSNDHKELFPWKLQQSDGGIVADNQEVGHDFGELVNAFRAISNEVTVPKVFVCPSDPARKAARSFDPNEAGCFGGTPPSVDTGGLSYLTGWEASETRAQSILLADGFLGLSLPNGEGSAGRSGIVKSFGLGTKNDARAISSNVGWTNSWHRRQANIGLADGRAHQVAADSLGTFFVNSIVGESNLTYRLVMPRWATR